MSSRLCDGMVFAFAAWTILCNATVYLGGSLETLLLACLGTALLACVILVLLRRKKVRSSAAREQDTLATPRTEGEVARPLAPSTLAALVLALALTLCHALLESLQLLWWLSVLYFVFALLTSPRIERDRACAAQTSRTRELAVWLLALGMAAIPLFAHKGTPDDALYLNIAVSAVDQPGAALLQHDTQHGIAGAPFAMSAYKVHSVELLSGAIAQLTGIEVVKVSHWLLPSLFTLFLVFATARLLRWLAPDVWPWALVATLVVLALLTGSPQGYGYFAFLRMHQGKAIFLCVFVPLLLVYGLRFVRRPSWRGWLLLFAAQIAAMGMSSTAIWAAPALVALAMASGIRVSRRGLRDLLLGMSASLYVLLAGVALRRGILDQLGESEEGVRLVSTGSAALQSGDELVLAAWQGVIGTGLVAALCLFAALSAWLFCGSALGRRLCIFLPLGTLLFFLNPFTALEIASSITVAETYWRVLWLLPVPVLAALVLSSPLRLCVGRPGGALLFALLMLACVSWAARSEIPLNRIHWEPFGLKVHQGATYRHAGLLNEHAAPGAKVLAPRFVSTWVPTFPGHAYPLVSRQAYLMRQAEWLGEEEVERRIRLQDYVSGDPNGLSAQDLAEAIRRDELEGICFAREHADAASIRQVLGSLELRAVYDGGRFETWVKRVDP